METKEIPQATVKEKELPDIRNAENSVEIGGQWIEIFPTKLKYQRNRTANFYKVLEIYPLIDVINWEAGTFGEDDNRSGDQAVMEWLIAVTDNEKLIKENYNEINNETVETLIAIFKRINKINDKEEARKNLLREKTRASNSIELLG